MFIAAQCVIAEFWKQPKYLSIEEWTRKDVAYLYNEVLEGYKERLHQGFCK